MGAGCLLHCLSEKVETLYQQVSEFFRANLLTALFPALELWFVFVCVCVEIQPVHPKGDQSWVFIGATDAEAETPILWPPHAKS